jgi:hypothetical protein
LPCSPGVHASGASKRAARCAGQCLVAQPQHHPTPFISPHAITIRISISTYHSEILKRPSLLNVPQRLLQILQLLINHGLGVLRALDSLGLERLDGLDLAAHVVRGRLEGLELLLDLVDDGRVLERAAVSGEVDRLRQLRQLLNLAAGVIVALLEGDEGVGCIAAQAELAGQLGPVELESCASL